MSAATAFAADPGGSYSVAGSNPGGGGKYSGTVTVEKTGQTYRVIWIVGGMRYVRTGIGDKDFLAISYKAGSDTGVALYGSDGGNWAACGPMPAAVRPAPKSGSAIKSYAARPRWISTPNATPPVIDTVLLPG